MSFKQDAVIIEPDQAHKKSVIWLHGLGADGHDFEPVVPELRLADESGVRFIFPNAPVRPVTINGGMAMRAWYDVKAPNLREQEDVAAIAESTTIIGEYINQEIKAGLRSTDIVLAGFSQGGAITLHAGLRYPSPLAGLIALSTYLPIPDRLADEASKENRSIPILMGHGIADPVIPVEQGRNSCSTLKELGYDVEWNEYMMQHAVCMQEIETIGKWLADKLG